MTDGASSPARLSGWGALGHSARLYLLHVVLLTASLAIVGLFFNIAILALGFSLDFLGLLNSVSFASAALLSVPLLWLVGRMRLRRALLFSAALQCASVLLLALWPTPPALLGASVLTGAAAVLFEISAPPFMMRHTTPATRDMLFSASSAARIVLAGLGSLLAGQLPSLAGRLFQVGPASGLAYRATLGMSALGLALSALPLLAMRAESHEDAPAAPPYGSPADEVSRPAPEIGIKTDERGTGPVLRGPWRPGRFLGFKQLASRAAGLIPPVWRDLAREPIPLLKLLASPALISVGAALLIPYLNLFFRQRFVVDDQLLGAIFAGLGVCTGAAALAAPRLSARLGRIHTVVLTQALALPFLVLLGWAPWLGLAVGAALARAALFNMGVPLYDAFALERSDPAARPTVIALINGAYSLGYAVAPLISVRVQASYGFGPLFAATAVCYALAVLAKYWFFMRAPHYTDVPPYSQVQKD
jgi:predicted MFS family arabinose efflux permease